jgi:hypothetical protein
MNTSTTAKMLDHGMGHATLVIDNGHETYRRTGLLGIHHGMAYLTVDRGTLHEYAITLGGPNTPIRYV